MAVRKQCGWRFGRRGAGGGAYAGDELSSSVRELPRAWLKIESAEWP